MTDLSEQLDLLYFVASRLGELNERVVYLGGCAVGLVIDNANVTQVRPTRDVDVIVEVLGRGEYYALEEELRQRGFTHDIEGPICRWRVDEVIVDVMPDDEAILGFSNRWYGMAIRTAEPRRLRDLTIRVVTPPLLLATKMAAFRSRGGGDYLASHDLEDLLAVIEGRPSIVRDCFEAPQEVRAYLGAEFSELLADSDFINALPGLSALQVGGAGSADALLERVRNLADTLVR